MRKQLAAMLATLFLLVPSIVAQSKSYVTEFAKLTVAVQDENAIPVAGARVQLKTSELPDTLRCETDFTGRCEFSNLPIGPAELRVERTGFYASNLRDLQVGTIPEVDVTLVRTVEVHEVVKVEESVPGIDPAQISSKEELTGSEIIDIPYPGPHDYRNALTYIPGVNPDALGGPHINGAEGFETLTLLDGFNVTQPGTGNLDIRTGVDSFRSISVEASREPAEFGKGSGGILNLNTGMGNDHLHFVSTDFVPSVQDTRGIHLGGWTPIVTVSGPIREGKMWFTDSLDGEYDLNIIPAGDLTYSDHVWRADNLTKLQANLAPHNIVTVSFLENYFRDPHSGVSALAPPEATPIDAEFAVVSSIKDQYSFKSGTLLETGFGVDQYYASLIPAGTAPYAVWLGSASGNYYESSHTVASRWQTISNLYLAPRHWHGRHDIKVGTDLDRLKYEGSFIRQPISFLIEAPPSNQPPQACATDSAGVPIPPYTCSRYSVFTGGGYTATYNVEASGYAEDRWLLTNRLLVEPGLRFDWDEIVRQPLVSPRLAGTYIFDDAGNTKLSAGIGIIYDATFLGWIAQAQQGQRIDYLFECPETSSGACSGPVVPTDANGNPTAEPVPIPTGFEVNRGSLEAPRFLNWSAALEKRLPAALFMKLEFIEKRGVHGFVYNSTDGAEGGTYVLENTRNDQYDSFTVSLRHNFRQRYAIFGAYTRSRSYSNQVLDFGLDFLVWSPQLPGPYGWDVPNRFVGWGIIPASLRKGHSFDVVYGVEARNGLPFNVANDRLQMIPADPPGTFRLPTYFSLNLAVEKRVHLFGNYWAVRAGFNNITNHGNAAVANGILDPQHPVPTFSDQAGRGFEARLRLLGRN